MRVIVIGAGVVGCSIALELARAGGEVLVVDRLGEAGHGTTSASCGIVRRFYSQPEMVAIAAESLEIWADWAAFVGAVGEETAVFHRCGVLFLPPRLDPEARRIVADMQACGVRVEILPPEALRARFPSLDLASHSPPRAPDDPAFFEPTGRQLEGGILEDGGYVVSPDLATHNLRRAAERLGATFRMNQMIVSARRRGSGLLLESAAGQELAADAVVNAAGPHSAQVNRLLGITLPLETRPLRREVHALSSPWPAASGPMPVVLDLDSGVYFRPESGGRDLIVGTTDPPGDALEWLDDPDACSGSVTELYHRRQCLRLMKRLPEACLGPRRGVASLYDVTVQDWYPIVDRTDQPGCYVAIGTSGSSFKTAPVLGQILARIVEVCAAGADPDAEPVEVPLPRTGRSVSTRFLSRHRAPLRSTGTVVG